jgi:hypothetical protein
MLGACSDPERRACRIEIESPAEAVLGIIAFAVSDSSFAYFTEVNRYGSGSAFDIGWVLGICSWP